METTTNIPLMFDLCIYYENSEILFLTLMVDFSHCMRNSLFWTYGSNEKSGTLYSIRRKNYIVYLCIYIAFIIFLGHYILYIYCQKLIFLGFFFNFWRFRKKCNIDRVSEVYFYYSCVLFASATPRQINKHS